MKKFHNVQTLSSLSRKHYATNTTIKDPEVTTFFLKLVNVRVAVKVNATLLKASSLVLPKLPTNNLEFTEGKENMLG